MIAMGRYGGFELSYGSDADVLFVHEPEAVVDQHEAASYAKAVAEEVRRTLALPGDDPPLVVDADLRPEGKQGPLVRTLDAYAAYYAKWSKVWEAQALLRADAVVGDAGLRERFTALIDPLRYPEAGLAEDDIVEMRRIKATGRQRAATARRGPLSPLQAGPRRPGRHRVDGPAAAAAARCRGRRPAHHPDPRRAGRGDRRRTALGRRCRRARERMANGQPGAQRGHSRTRKISRPDAPSIARTPRCGRDSGLFPRPVRRDGERLSAGHSTGPCGRRSSFLGMIDERSGGVTGSSPGCVMIGQSGRGRPPQRSRPDPHFGSAPSVSPLLVVSPAFDRFLAAVARCSLATLGAVGARPRPRAATRCRPRGRGWRHKG